MYLEEQNQQFQNKNNKNNNINNIAEEIFIYTLFYPCEK